MGTCCVFFFKRLSLVVVCTYGRVLLCALRFYLLTTCARGNYKFFKVISSADSSPTNHWLHMLWSGARYGAGPVLPGSAEDDHYIDNILELHDDNRNINNNNTAQVKEMK